MIRLINIIFSLFVSLIFPTTCWSAESASLLFNGNCATCHHLKKASSAPTINQIRTRYLNAFPKKEDFVDYMSNWVANPKKESSLMLDMILKYGLMPQLAFEKETLREIAEYIYDGNIEATTH